MKRAMKLTGIQFRKRDLAFFVVGMALPLILLFLLFLMLRYRNALLSVTYFQMLLRGRGKLVYYLGVGLLEELLFRGVLFGFLFEKIKNVVWSALLSAVIFAVPHAINANIPIPVLLLFSFAFGILACEIRCYSKSIWMSTGFHWTWNYTIVSVFMATNTNRFLYGWITAEIVALSIVCYLLMKKAKKPLSIW